MNVNMKSEQITYLDDDYLLKGELGDSPIKAIHREWFINQATIFSHFKNVDEETRKQLEFLILHGYSKVSISTEKEYEHLGVQTTPLMLDDCCYHRVTRNEFLNKVNEIYAQFLALKPHELFVIDSALLKEVFARELPQPGLNLNVEHPKDFEKLIAMLLLQAQSGQFPNQRLFVDISNYQTMQSTQHLKAHISALEDILMEKLKRFLEANPNIQLEEISDLLLSKLHLVTFVQYKDQEILLLPEFLMDPRFDSQSNALIQKQSVLFRHGEAYREIDSMISRNGFRLDPAQAKEAWLKLQDVQTILKGFKLPFATFAIPHAGVPLVCRSFQAFMQMPVVSKFKALSKGTCAPYLQILPEATWSLLSGLARYTRQGGMQQQFKNKGIEGLLQTSYFRMFNAMNEAILRKDDQIAFQNQIEFIHQEIQNILAIVKPYKATFLADTLIHKLTSGEDPLVPSDLEKPRVHLKASAMRGLSSILASVEAEKGNPHLHIAILKDSYYYASNENLKKCPNYQLSVLDSDQFDQHGIDQAFDHPVTEPIDLFVCEFHHNILQRQTYRAEKVLEQVKAMITKGLVAKKLTLVIDTTIAFEKSEEVKALLHDLMIKTLIQGKKLNIVLLRSAQKFDMLGIDNYYGGITVSLNQSQAFKRFNARMDMPQDQLRGVSYQGLSHLHACAGSSLEAFRKGVMDNTRKLYNKLPKEAIYYLGIQNPMQISQMHDDHLFFLDIKFPHYPKTQCAFLKQLKKFAQNENLFFTTRPSFSFSNTNFTLIEHKMRLSIGLEDEQILDRYAAFMHSIQSILDQVKEMEEGITDELLARSISTATI